MDFRAALGLNVASDATPDDIRGALAISKTIVVRTITSIPDPSVICGKFLRLQRYCAITTRMHLEGLMKTSSTSEPIHPQADKISRRS